MRSYLLSIFLLLTTTLVYAQTTPAKRFYEKVDVGGYKLAIHCSGEGSPTVIIESGFGEPGADSGTWAKVNLEINDVTRVCTYNRAGLGSSDPIPTESRTSQDVVNDLHTLLTNANIAGPYILVGHSIGGFRLYADQYPDEVVGMVLEDSSHPDQFDKTLELLPPERPDESESLKMMRIHIDDLPQPNQEKFVFRASSAQVRATKSLGNLPLVVVTQSSTCKDDEALPSEVRPQLIQMWQDFQVELAKLSTNSTHIVAETACHYVHLDEPELVIDAILKVLEEVRQ
jgi:pimeloyl-ACP methyl ester carboxylesterase